ncbi:MAG: hypothetical protein RLZZ59_46 [Pseudomonadota bacterium]|jgi:UDP-N-acetylmuramoyl-tripeptide--D-alanyl-D-alanine ligase
MSWNNKTLSEALGINIEANAQYGAIQYNSTDVKDGDIFIAMRADALPTIKGTKDSHIYVKDALDRGAVLAIVEHEIDGVDNSKLLIVSDSFEALRKMASYKRQKSKAKFIAITGSAGKTSTKEAMHTALSHFGKTFANPGTFNNELGARLTLASIPLDAEYVVMEVGMNHAGEIRSIINDIAPDYVMINNILPVHLENFESIKGIADAKLEILEGLKPGGTALFNADSEFYGYACDKAKALGVKEIYGFGEELGNGILLEYHFENGASKARVSIEGRDFVFTTAIAGKHRILNLVGVLTMCFTMELDPKEASRAFALSVSPKGRGEVHQVNIYGYKCTIIDDSYNASPVATKESLMHLKSLDSPKKIVILGNMMELGPNEIEYHKGLLPHVIDAGVSKLYTVGNLMKYLYDIAPDDIKGVHYENYLKLEDDLSSIIDGDMMILLKGSKSQKLSYIVEKLLSKEVQEK